MTVQAFDSIKTQESYGIGLQVGRHIARQLI